MNQCMKGIPPGKILKYPILAILLLIVIQSLSISSQPQHMVSLDARPESLKQGRIYDYASDQSETQILTHGLIGYTFEPYRSYIGQVNSYTYIQLKLGTIFIRKEIDTPMHRHTAGHIFTKFMQFMNSMGLNATHPLELMQHARNYIVQTQVQQVRGFNTRKRKGKERRWNNGHSCLFFFIFFNFIQLP